MQDYVVHSRIRNVLRALIVMGVFDATISFFVVKYATDDSLRNSTETVREDNYQDLSQVRRLRRSSLAVSMRNSVVQAPSRLQATA